MKSKNILICLSFSSITIAIIISIIFMQYEIISNDITTIAFFSLFALWLTFPILFYISFIKTKKKVEFAKTMYIEERMPKKPLRFCPADHELIALYKSKISEKEQEKFVETNNNFENSLTKSQKYEDEEEMTM